MKIPIQIDTVSIARATNAAHYEYLDTVRKRIVEIRLKNKLWHPCHRGVAHFIRLNSGVFAAFGTAKTSRTWTRHSNATLQASRQPRYAMPWNL